MTKAELVDAITKASRTAMNGGKTKMKLFNRKSKLQRFSRPSTTRSTR